MGTYSFLDVTASLTGPTGVIDLGAGSANAEEGIVVTMSDVKNTTIQGADGEIMHCLTPGRSGQIQVNLLKTSPINKKLSLAYNAQTMSSTLWGKNVIVIRNSASGDSVTARAVAFNKLPEFKNGNKVETVTWSFDCGHIDQILGTF